MTILIIEDDLEWIRRITAALSTMNLETIIPYELDKVGEAIRNGGYDAVILDACWGGDRPNTIHFIGEIRQTGFKGPIIGNSVNFNDTLLKAGCSHVNAKKTEVNILKEALRLRS